MKLKYIFLAISLMFAGVSCDSDDEAGIVPSDISNVHSDANPGQIVLRWDMPSGESNIHYVEVDYFDHRLKKNVKNLSSCDSLLIDNTRKKYGDYEFKLTPVSFTQTPGNTLDYNGMSGPAPKTVTVVGEQEIEFGEGQIVANSISGSSGPYLMFDNDESTIYHSAWRGGPKIEDAYIDFDLGEEISAFKINWLPRTNRSEAKVVDLDLLGSTDGENWFLIKNLTKEADKLPVDMKTWYKSPVIFADQPFSKLRYQVKKTNKNNQFWHMSEMEIFKVELDVIDPESPDFKE
ncbi:discoidin domain-containing protein [Puteibacter caeruleilacunae]|nr:discoidin domain-containing protein [Puteibacter caeruleilacunae]